MRGPLSYIGGKNRLADQIIQMFPEHKTYVEPFAGGAQVFFHKAPSKVEVLNDLDGEIVNFYRVCQSHYEELIRQFKFLLVGREQFDRFKTADPAQLTDIQRAARYMYLQKTCYGGLVTRKNFGQNVTQPPGFNLERLPQILEDSHARLARVQIEHLPYDQILERYDRPTTFFYLDPPYYEKYLYRFNLKPEEFVLLRDRLKKLKGKFILSLNDVPEVRKIFSDFKIKSVDLYYTAQQKAGRRFKEVIIKNF
jgi:DNA adenine methylase